jgi:hypothetical protein
MCQEAGSNFFGAGIVADAPVRMVNSLLQID